MKRLAKLFRSVRDWFSELIGIPAFIILTLIERRRREKLTHCAVSRKRHARNWARFYD